MENAELEVPEYFICPISLQIMKDPVTAISGITYDRESIERWLLEGQNSICPVTKQPLPRDSDLTPNHMLRRLIQAWCTANAASGIERIPTPKPPLSKLYVINLIRDLSIPNSILKTLHKLEELAKEHERNRKHMVEAGVPKAMFSIILACHKRRDTTGLEEALNILNLIRNHSYSTTSNRTKPIYHLKIDAIIDSLTWVMGCDHTPNHLIIKSHAICVLRTVVQAANSGTLETLNLECFRRIVYILNQANQGITQKGIKAALKILLHTCPWGRNRIMMVESGAVFALIEMELNSPVKKITERIFGVLFHLCSCADGRAQVLSHAGGIAVISRRILKVSPLTDERAISVISLITKYSGTVGVLQEMLRVGTFAKLCVVLQADCASYLKDKAREMLRTHSDVWKDSPCIDRSSCLNLQV